MSIATRTGDEGDTSLMFGRRVPKTHVRVEAYGTVDELNSAIGLARAHAGKGTFFSEPLIAIQKDLVALMGELATAAEDLERYRRGGYASLTPTSVEKIDQLIHHFEHDLAINYKGWATPGGTIAGGAFDLARTICRRAERRLCALEESEGPLNSLFGPYLNRLSDLLWLCARWAEQSEV
ncbi:MAG: cob(I)yrinic acid a,c-diamide adenosyltransferase [Verrucomicrobiia bacterium]